MRTLYLILVITLLFQHALCAHTVTPWLTRGDQSVLLTQQQTVSFSGNVNPTSTSITIDQNMVAQQVEGYGFCLTQGSAEVINSLTATKRDELLNELFGSNGLGVSAIRISIGASDLSNSVYSYNETAGDVNMDNFSLAGPDLTHLIPLLQEILLINPDIKILATPWTAPTWMKDNGSWIGGSLIPTYYAAYGLYFVKYLQAMQSYGIDIWAITPQNEPENPFNEPSMLMSAAEQTDFINNHLGPAIQQAGYSTKIIAFDHNCDNTDYPIQVLNNSAYAEGAAFHLYAGDISALSTVYDATGKSIYFTEQFTSSDGNFNGDFGWHMRNIVIGASNNWSKTVFEWNLATDTNYGPNTPGGCTDCLGALTITGASAYTRNVSYYIIGQIARFVSPGAQRIEAVSANQKIHTTAFKNTDGSVVVIAYNDNQQTKTVRVIDGGSAFDFDLPKKSAVSFVWNSSTTLSPPSPPASLTATALGAGSIELNWIDQSGNEDFFDIQRSPDGQTNWLTIASPTSNTTSFTDSNLDPSTTYFYRVRASNTAGNSNWSNVSSATTDSSNSGGGLSGVYNVLAQHSNKGLDVINQSANNNANVQQWEVINGGGDNQKWEVTENSDGTYQLKAVHSGRCLSIRSPNSSDVVQKGCDGGDAQKWALAEVETSYYSLTNLSNGQALEVSNASASNGADVVTGNYLGSAHQKWRFDPTTGSSSGLLRSNNHNQSSQVIIAPNPVKETLQLKIPASLDMAQLKLICVDVCGRILLARNVQDDKDLNISVVEFPEGIYFLKMQNRKGVVITKRFIVKR